MQRKKDEPAAGVTLLKAVSSLDVVNVRKLLDNGCEINTVDENDNGLLHLLAVAEIKKKKDPSTSNAIELICYMLVDCGINIEHENNNDKTPLELAVKIEAVKCCSMFLQCGASMHLPISDDLTLSRSILNGSDTSEEIVDAFARFHPGVIEAVTSKNISDVRRLVNLWCRTDLEKDGRSVCQLALDTGSEDIISLILSVHQTMQFVHSVLAGNIAKVKKMLKEHKSALQLDFRKMSHFMAPILYFVIEKRDADMIELLILNGSRIFVAMKDEEEWDKPVIFTCLVPDMPLHIVKALFSGNKKNNKNLLYQLLYRGKNLLQYALDNQVSLEVFKFLIELGRAPVLAIRNEKNETVREIAVREQKNQYVNLIDEIVYGYLKQEDPEDRQFLAILGYPDFSELDLEHTNNSISEEFSEELPAYQEQIELMFDAVKFGDFSQFTKSCYRETEKNNFMKDLSWYARVLGDGMPLLHTAVIWNRPEVVEFILKNKPDDQSIDTLFDQFHRTPLHYAYAIEEAEEIRKSLRFYGCSEHVLDYEGLEPLDFRNNAGSEEVAKMLENLKLKHIPSGKSTPSDIFEFSEEYNPQRTEFENYDPENEPSINDDWSLNSEETDEEVSEATDGHWCIML